MAHGRLFRHGMDALLLAGEPVTMDGLQRLFSSTPYPYPQTGAQVWPEDSALAHTLAKGIYRQRRQITSDLPTDSTPADIRTYFEREFSRPGSNRQSAEILSTFMGMADLYLSGPVKEIFCTTTNFVPEFSRKGAIIILDLALDEWEEIGRTAALTFKYIWQKAMLRRQRRNQGQDRNGPTKAPALPGAAAPEGQPEGEAVIPVLPRGIPARFPRMRDGTSKWTTRCSRRYSPG